MTAAIICSPLTIEIFRAGGDSRPLPLRIWHIVKALFVFIGQVFARMAHKIATLFVQLDIRHPEAKIDAMPWRTSITSKGLTLLLHGLHSKPGRWSKYLSDLTKQVPDAHHVAPLIPYRGNCAVEQAGEPLLYLVQDYAAKFPGKPITIIGHSNGARLASYIEGRLNLTSNPLTIVSIAGVHRGSNFIETARRIYCYHFLGLHPHIAPEIALNSTTARVILNAAIQKQAVYPARHLYYASTEDEVLKPVASALPYMPKAVYKIVHGVTHGSLPDHVRSDVLTSIFGQEEAPEALSLTAYHHPFSLSLAKLKKSQ